MRLPPSALADALELALGASWGKGSRPHLIWLDTQPQHFDTTDGSYVLKKPPKPGTTPQDRSECKPHSQAQLEHQDWRNNASSATMQRLRIPRYARRL
eukprot:scaffold1422_cov297-Prasinococcus_capsulatus_cf.AAC.11